ncbi:hypothetical protein M8818_003229 [Zalaria obscura]|uniref:Uncharacterized protein n=1 Tax=Zalaria obscura TaxID=2024903 RepID=A0ACC3SFF0_9PEZI
MAATASYSSTSPNLYQNQWDHAAPHSTQTNGSSRPLHNKRSANNINGHDGQQRGSDVRSRRPSQYSANTSLARKQSRETGLNEEDADADDSAWIHRDKLAQIESREMAEAGIRVRKPSSRSASRSASRASNKRARSREPHAGYNPTEEENRQLPLPGDQHPRTRMVPTRADEDTEDVGRDGTFDHELRTPEEVAAEFIPQTYSSSPPTQYPRTLQRPATSRIPIAKTSPSPLPNKVLERDSPLPRSRHGSNTFDDDGLAYQRPRHRSMSLGSQAMLDDAGINTGTPSRSRPASSHIAASPSAFAKAQPRTPSSAKRNITTPAPRSASGTKLRATSGAKPRPASSHHPRPSGAVNRPEGEAPWIATMYKPDPRLPPDQQLLPTLAKKKMQEQWEKEGKTGDAYDRDLRLLNDRDLSRGEDAREGAQRGVDEGDKGLGFDADRGRAAGGDAELSPSGPGASGGYKITPTIQNPQIPALRPDMVSSHTSIHGPPKAGVKRMGDVDEEKGGKEKEKGCCGCVMM